MSFLTALFIYPISFAVGWLLGTVIGVKNFWERMSLGWLLSTSLLSYTYFLLYAYAGWRFTWLNTTVLFVGSVVGLSVLLVGVKKYSWQQFRVEIQNHVRRWRQLPQRQTVLILTSLVAVPVLFTFILNLHWPVMDWDALALYDFRAKVFTMSGGMEDGIPRGYFLHYPLYTSMLHMFSYLYGIQSARTWYSLFYVCSLAVFYELLQRHTSQKRALVGTLFLAISPRIFQHAQMTYTNLPHSMYVALGYIYLMEWWRQGKRVDLLVGAALVAASTWVRLTEPFWLPAVVMILAGLLRWSRQWWLAVLAVALMILVRFPWTNFVAQQDHLSITNPLQIGAGLQLPTNPLLWVSRLGEVNTFFWASIYPLFDDFVPALIISSLYLLYKEKWRQLIEYGVFALMVLFIYAGIFVFSFQFKGWQLIPDSAARMSMFLLPVSLYLIMKSDLWLVPRSK